MEKINMSIIDKLKSIVNYILALRLPPVYHLFLTKKEYEDEWVKPLQLELKSFKPSDSVTEMGHIKYSCVDFYFIDIEKQFEFVMHEKNLMFAPKEDTTPTENTNEAMLKQREENMKILEEYKERNKAYHYVRQLKSKK